MTEARTDLESVQIPEPCSADWAAMDGDERRRYCDQCQLHVHNVAAMPRAEAEELLARRDEGERVCVRMEYAEDGTCITTDEPLESERPSRPLVTAWALALGTGMLAACRADEARDHPDLETIENSTVESAELIQLGEVIAPVVEELEGLEAVQGQNCELLGEARPVFMGRLSLDSPPASATTEGEPGDAAGPGGLCDGFGPLPPEAVKGTPGPSGTALPGPGSDTQCEAVQQSNAPKKGRVMLGSPGPRGPKQD